MVGMETDMNIQWKSKTRWSPVKVTEKMSSHIVCVEPERRVRELAEIMRDEHVGCIPVISGNQLSGMITDRDIVCRLVAEGRDPDESLARDIMTRPVHTCRADEPLADAAQTMEDQQVRRLPVVEEGGKVVGLLTADDLSWHTDHQLVGDVIEAVYERHG
jgi:CBS domain-containing protein